MRVTQTKWHIFLVVLLVVLVSGCSAPTPEDNSPPSVLAMVSPLSTPTLAPTPTVAPTATPAPPPSPIQLVVFHTNDNWGETEPCG